MTVHTAQAQTTGTLKFHRSTQAKEN